MNLNKIYNVYDIIKDRIPKTYPRPKLAFFEDERCMLTNNHVRPKKGENVLALVSPATYTINLPLSMTIEHERANGTICSKTTSISKDTDENIASILLHEIGHLYAGERYGYDSKQYHDENYCDRFADRWVKTLIKEKLI